MADTLAEAMAQATTEDAGYDVLTISNDLRTISVPADFVLGVYQDEDVHRVYFKMPRMYGETDLSKYSTVRVNYQNANGEGDYYTVEDKTADGDSITFSWLVGRFAFASAGQVRFSVCIRLVDSAGTVTNEFNTTVVSVPVLEGLETDSALDTAVQDAMVRAENAAERAKKSADTAKASETAAKASETAIKASADQIAANKKALQTPTTVTDPTSKTVLLAGSQGIDYSKLADAIIAKYTGQTLAGKAQAVKTAIDLVKNQTDRIIDVVNGKPFENVRWSGEKLGSTFTAEQLAYIQNNEGYQLGLGSYWTDEAQGITWRNLDFNFLLKKGDSALNKYHSLVMPDACLLKADGSSTHYMQDSNDNATANGYNGTKYRSTYRSQCKTKFANFFGSHVLTHREMLTNASTNGQASGWSWYDCDVELPSEDMIYGSSPWGNSTQGGGSGYNVGINYGRIAGFESHPELIHASRENYWLRTICTASNFAHVNANGDSNGRDASNPWVGLRPYALIG